MKNLMRKVIMLLVIIIGIGGACWAKECGAYMGKVKGVELTCHNDLQYDFIDSNYHQPTCPRGIYHKNITHAKEKHNDNDGNGICNDCKYVIPKKCKVCGMVYENNDDIDGNGICNSCDRNLIIEEGKQQTQPQPEVCNHQTNEKGYCATCKKTTNWTKYNAWKAEEKAEAAPITITSHEDEWGSLIINMSHITFKVDSIVSVHLNVAGNLLEYEEGIDSVNKDSDNIKRIDCEEGQSLWIMDGTVMYIIRPNSSWADDFGTIGHNFEAIINNGTELKKGTDIVVGCFESSPTNNDKNSANLCEKGHKFGVDSKAFVCEICGFECKEYEKSNYIYKSKNGYIDVEQHMRYCENSEHNHGNMVMKGKHEDNGNGICKKCAYPCMNGHTYNKDKYDTCSKCSYVDKERTTAQANKKATGFYDVATDAWSKDAIKFVVDKKIMSGMEDGIFNPTGNVTRAQLATIIKRVADDKKIEIEKKKGYEKVKYNNSLPSWAEDAILLVGTHIPEKDGYLDTSNKSVVFSSDEEITRRQVIQALNSAFNLEQKVTVSQSTKNKVSKIKKNENITSDRLIKVIEVIVEAGIIQGDGEKINLESKISRQEMAKIIQNLYNVKLEGKTETETKEKCTTKNCTADIVKWEKVDEKAHNVICAKGHEKSERHTIENNKCTKCTYEKTTTDDSETKQKCTKSGCKGYILAKYKVTSKVHKTLCSKGHVLKEENHTSDNICSKCYYNKKTGEVVTKEEAEKESNKTTTPTTNTVTITRCNICNSKTEWFKTETLHINRCTKDISHVFRIEGHRFDSNNKCEDCEYKNKKTYKSNFKDFQDSNHWAWRNVCYMAEQGIVKGTYNEEDKAYSLKPDEPITAEAFMALLARILGYKGEVIDTVNYMPIDSGWWSVGEWKYLMNYIDKNTNKDAKQELQKVLADNGTSGSDEEIKKNYRSNITREKAGYLISIFLESNQRNYTLADKFVDWNDVESYYKDSQYKLSAYDILRGIEEDGKLYIKPKSSITRVQAITFIDRFNSVMKANVKYH